MGQPQPLYAHFRCFQTPFLQKTLTSSAQIQIKIVRIEIWQTDYYVDRHREQPFYFSFYFVFIFQDFSWRSIPPSRHSFTVQEFWIEVSWPYNESLNHLFVFLFPRKLQKFLNLQTKKQPKKWTVDVWAERLLATPEFHGSNTVIINIRRPGFKSRHHQHHTSMVQMQTNVLFNGTIIKKWANPGLFLFIFVLFSL